MKIFDVTWEQFKEFVETKSSPVQFVLGLGKYHVLAFDEYYGVQCDLNITAEGFEPEEDTEDFQTNFMPTANKQLGYTRDEDGAQVVNPKFAGSGRGYNSLHLEIRIGVAGSLYCKDRDGNDLTFVQSWTEKEDGSIITTPEDAALAVVTKVVLAPTIDYDLQGFCLYQNSRPPSDIRMWAVITPFLPVEYGGPKEVITGLNLKLSPYDKTFMDYVGDSATPIKYLGPGTNEQMLIFKHPENTDHKIMGELFWYV